MNPPLLKLRIELENLGIVYQEILYISKLKLWENYIFYLKYFIVNDILELNWCRKANLEAINSTW